MSDDQTNWASFMQKLGKAPENGDKSAEDINPLLAALQQDLSQSLSNRESPEIREPPQKDKEAQSTSSKSESALNTMLFNYIDEKTNLRINNVQGYDASERSGRTIAINSRFICYSDTNKNLVIKSLKNLNLFNVVKGLKEKVADIVFYEDLLSNHLAVILRDGTFLVYNIDLNASRDNIILAVLLKFQLNRTCESAQIQWKTKSNLSVAIDKDLISFQISTEKSEGESGNSSPTPFSQQLMQFEEPILDFFFSPSYPLLFLLFPNNSITIHNFENDFILRRFSIPGDKIARLLPYRSLIRHDLNRSGEGNELSHPTWREIFVTITSSFEIKVWDLSEWDEPTHSYYCIETFQLPQNNDKLDPIALTKRFAFYDAGMNFLFVGFKTNGDKGICIHALHIDQFYYGYNDMYEKMKKAKKFFNFAQTVWFKKNDVTDFSVLSFADDDIEYYFKKGTYMQMSDTEPASTKTQDGSYAFNSKSMLSFFLHSENHISVFEAPGEKIYPVALVDDLDKVSQSEQFETQSIGLKHENSDSSHPPEMSTLSPFLKVIHDQSKRSEQGQKEEEKEGFKANSAEPEGRGSVKDSGKKEIEGNSSPNGPKQHHSHSRKSKGGRDKEKVQEKEKEKEAPESHEGSTTKPKVASKIITRESHKSVTGLNPTQIRAAAEIVDKDFQVELVEKGIEKKLQGLSDKIPQMFTTKLKKIEEAIESKFNERFAKLQSEVVAGAISKEIDDKLDRLFSKAFEKSVTPCFEKYLIRIFEQVNNNFEKGQKFYIDKLNIEQAKAGQVKETMNEVVKSFVQISNALTEGYSNNQANLQRMESSLNEKQDQIALLLEKMGKIIQKQQEIQSQVDNIETSMQELLGKPPGGGFPKKRYLEEGVHSQNYIDEDQSNKQKHLAKRDNQYPQQYPIYPGYGGQYPHPSQETKSKDHPLNDQLAYLQGIMSGYPMEKSGGNLPRGPPIQLPGMNSPANAQLPSNPYNQQQQQQQFDYNNPYGKLRGPSQPFFPQNLRDQQTAAQHMPPNAQHIPSQNHPQNIPQTIPQNLHQQMFLPINQQSTPNPTSNNVMPPDLQMLLGEFLRQQSQNKEEVPEKRNSVQGQDNAGFQTNAPQSSRNSLTSQRALSQTGGDSNPQAHIPRTQSQTPIQDKESGDDSKSLPPGIGTPTQTAQPNFIENFFQSLPQNLQQQLSSQNPIPPKLGGHITQTTSNTNSPPLGLNLGGQGQPQTIFNPGFYFQNPSPQQNQNNNNFSGATGYYGLPQTMTNPQVKSKKNTSQIDISQIPMVNSMFKSPSRDTNTEDSLSRTDEPNNS